MNESAILNATADYIKDVFHDEGSGHDWWHMYRVWKLAKNINRKEGGDCFVVEMAALLHDLDDHKLTNSPDYYPLKHTKDYLLTLNINSSIAEHILDIVANISFKGANVKNTISTLEGKVVQDADRLDAIGAIGIARAFAYGGFKGDLLYDPVTVSVDNILSGGDENKKSSVGHFYEKLLLLKDRMNTRTGREIAEKRHDFMECYLSHFFLEWEAKDL